MTESTKKHFYEYLKTNLDVVMKWVEFQNSFGKIPNTSSFSFEPELYQMRTEILTELEEITIDHKGLNTTTVKQLVVSLFLSKLIEKGYPQVAPYVTNLDEEKVIELTTALYTRRSILASLTRMEDIKLENTDTTNRLYNTYLHKLRWLRLSTSLSHTDYSDNLLSVYMEFLPIEQDNEKSSLSYISEALFYIKRMESLYRNIMNKNGVEVETLEDINAYLDNLQEELDGNQQIDSFWSLIFVSEVFEKHINGLKVLTKDQSQAKSLKLT